MTVLFLNCLFNQITHIKAILATHHFFTYPHESPLLTLITSVLYPFLYAEGENCVVTGEDGHTVIYIPGNNEVKKNQNKSLSQFTV